MCPSATRFEGEIVAMTLDLMHAEAVASHHPNDTPCGSVTSGGTESIITALLAYRDKFRAERGIKAPEIILPETAHPAFDKGAHLFGIEVVRAPVDPATTLVDVDFVRAHINENTVVLVGSAGNYPYGTIDPIAELSELALGARHRPARRRLPRRLHPAVGRSSSATTSRCSTSACPASPPSPPTRTSTATASRAPRW